MKKVIYLIAMIFAFVFISTSCSKKNDDDILSGITVDELIGDWYFQSLEFNGKVYEVGGDFTDLIDYDFFRVSFLKVTPTRMDLFNRGNNMPSTWGGISYKLSRNTISIQDWFEFHVENWETFDGSVLIVKLLKSNEFKNTPVGGIFTMTSEEPI